MPPLCHGAADVPRLLKSLSQRLHSQFGKDADESKDTIEAEAITHVKLPKGQSPLGSPLYESLVDAPSQSQSPLGSPLAGRISRRPFHRKAPRKPATLEEIGHLSVTEAAEAAEAMSDLLAPFYSKITGGIVRWQTDADVGLVLERRTIVTATGRGRKEVVSVRKIWPWSPAFASGSLVVHDILVSIDGENVDEMELSDVRAMLRGEEGSTVILETLHLVKGVDFEPDKVTQRYIELERSVDYLRRDPIPPPRIPWPDRRKYQDRAFFCLSLESWPRRACIYLIESRAFQAFSMLLILGSSVLIGLYDPLENTASAQRETLRGRPCTTTEGVVCHFPFTYNGNVYTECTRNVFGYLWCATTEDYFEDEEWGYCDARSCDKLGPNYWRHQLRNINVVVIFLLIAGSIPMWTLHSTIYSALQRLNLNTCTLTHGFPDWSHDRKRPRNHCIWAGAWAQRLPEDHHEPT